VKPVVRSLFKKKTEAIHPLPGDFHSHLIPGLDDGVKTAEEALAVIRALYQAGARHIVTTPHIAAHVYPNTKEKITGAFAGLHGTVKKLYPDLTFEAAAEYYLDEHLMTAVQQPERLLTLGNDYLLFETNYLSEPLMMTEFIFHAFTHRYQPVLAHPERYQYMTVQKAADLRARGTHLQLNLLSLIGYYSPSVQKLAEKLIDRGLITAISSDFHTPAHAKLLPRVMACRYYKKVISAPLINFTLIS
jgi:tyrosine-protein phosphatase YwqE